MAEKLTRRRPVKAAILPTCLSALMPGCGQILNRDFVKGFFLLAVSLGSIFWFYSVLMERLSLILSGAPEQWASNPSILREGITKIAGENPDMFFSFQLLMITVWWFSVVDAFFTARRFPPAPPPENDEA
jgi:TM2 domain-containing membrane protein YozV